MLADDTVAPTALIAEDEPLLAQALAADLARLWPQLRVVASVGDGDSALAHTLSKRPRIVFLDIRMPGRSGLDVAQALAEDWPAGGSATRRSRCWCSSPRTTSTRCRPSNGQAVDYLLKPVDARASRNASRGCSARSPSSARRRRISRCGTRWRNCAGCSEAAPAPVAAPRLDVIQAGVGNTVHMVPVDDVLYFEAADKYLRVVTAEREHLVRLSLRELLPQLDAQRFWQVHRSIVVQARMIRSAQREESGKVTLTLRDRPEKLTASRLYAHLFRGS